MKRERATTLLNDMLNRLEEGGWPLDLVDEILVFGSYARGALNPSDVDLIVEHRRDDRLTSEFLHSLSYGGDPSASMKRALKGRSRGLQIHFGERKSLEAEGFELTLLWTRGEPVDAARARLAAITPGIRAALRCPALSSNASRASAAAIPAAGPFSSPLLISDLAEVRRVGSRIN